jgi:putative ABC transport system substrate-binding protein
VKRRWLIQLLGGAVAAAPVSIRAQQPAKARRIAIITTTSPLESAYIDAFVRGLHQLGHTEGRNIVIERRWGRGSTERFPEFAAEAVSLNVDVIVAANGAAGLAARKATATIPIVVATMDDPIGSGFAASLARPGGNVTGLTLLTPDLQGKRLQLFKEALPKLSRVMVLIDVAGRPRAAQTALTPVEAAARALGIRVGPVVEVRRPDDIAAALAAISNEGAPDGVLSVGGTMFFANRSELGRQALANAAPMMCDLRDQAVAGCLMSYGADLAELFRRAAGLVDKILDGATPAELPIEQPTKFELVINLRTAKALGLDLPPSLLARADEVIE